MTVESNGPGRRHRCPLAMGIRWKDPDGDGTDDDTESDQRPGDNKTYKPFVPTRRGTLLYHSHYILARAGRTRMMGPCESSRGKKRGGGMICPPMMWTMTSRTFCLIGSSAEDGQPRRRNSECTAVAHAAIWAIRAGAPLAGICGEKADRAGPYYQRGHKPQILSVGGTGVTGSSVALDAMAL